jgi:hypothetical protein
MKEDVEQLTKGKSEEEAEMKRYLPSVSKKPDPSVTKRTQPFRIQGFSGFILIINNTIKGCIVSK